MKKLSTRITATALSAMLTLSMLTACGGGKDTDNKPEEGGSDAIDFMDRNFKFVSTESDTTNFGYGNTTLFSDYVLEHKQKFETDYKCTISEEHIVYTALKNTMSGFVGSGQTYADQLLSNDESLKNIVAGEYLEPIDNYSESVNIADTSKWGTYELLESVMYKGTIYAVHPMLWPQRFVSFYTPIVYNSEILSAAGYTDPREYYENGSWNRELFTEIIDTTASSDLCTYGLTSSAGFIYQMALLGNNAYLYTKSEDGSYISGTDSIAFTEALDWAYNLLHDHASAINTGLSWDEMRIPFTDGDAAMLMYPTWGLFGGVDQTIKWGLLPFPNGPYREFGDWGSYMDGNSGFVSVPVNTEDLDDLSLFMNMFYEPFAEYSSEADLMDYYRTNLFFDDRDFNLFFSLSTTARYNYWFEGGNPIVTTLNSSSTAPAAAIEMNKDLVNKILTESLSVNRAAIDRLYEEMPPLK